MFALRRQLLERTESSDLLRRLYEGQPSENLPAQLALGPVESGFHKHPQKRRDALGDMEFGDAPDGKGAAILPVLTVPGLLAEGNDRRSIAEGRKGADYTIENPPGLAHGC